MTEPRPEPTETRGGSDLRLVGPAVAAWLGALSSAAPRVLLVAAGAGALLGVTAWWWRSRGAAAAVTATAAVAVGLCVAGVGAVRLAQVAHDPVTGLARRHASIDATGVVTGDPVLRTGRFADVAVLRVRLTMVSSRGGTYAVRVPVVVSADPDWRALRLGSTIRFHGTLDPSDDPSLAGFAVGHGEPEVVRGPDPWWRAADRVRAALRDAVDDRPPDQAALVPALVVGDDAGMASDLQDDFRATGLTHLTAVSGTNLTLLVGFLLLVGRWCGVRGRAAYVLAALGIVGFLLLARAEPSVLRAAAMGTVGLLGLGSNGRSRGTRALGAAVVALLLLDPALGRSVGFALSVLATAGILLLAPALRDALAGWTPRWMAEALAVPTAAQLACTPLVAAISGKVSLVAVAANLLVAPVVGPATVLGLVAGLAGLAWAPAGTLLGTAAAWCVAWIVWVAQHGAGLPTAQLGWGTGAAALAALTAVTLAVAWLLPGVLRRPPAAMGCCAVLTVAVLVPVPTPGWPPAGWVLVACDVGQGDALVLNAGPRRAVLVDAGPDPRLVDECLRRLGVAVLPLVVLTHFHADHVDGLRGALDGRAVGEIEVTALADPPEGAREVGRLAAAAGIPVRVATDGETERLGDLTWQDLWPPPDPAQLATEGSRPNNASVVLLVEVRGVRLLLTGDVEPEAQRRLAAAFPGLRVDVLKVPHHGSRHQDLDFLTSLTPRLAVVSVGADNDYGHPAPETLLPFAAAGVPVLRTDRSGDIAITAAGGRLAAATSR